MHIYEELGRMSLKEQGCVIRIELGLISLGTDMHVWSHWIGRERRTTV